MTYSRRKKGEIQHDTCETSGIFIINKSLNKFSRCLIINNYWNKVTMIKMNSNE